MTFAELLWLYHQESIEYIRENTPLRMRSYLTETGDDETLIEWDNSRMKDSSR